MTPFQLAWRNVTRRPIPTAIAIVSIAISVACSGILLRLNLLSENRFAGLGRGGDAIIGAKAGGIEMVLGALGGEGDEPGFLPYKLFESLRAEQTVHFEDGATARPSFVKSIIPFLYFGRFREFRVVGTDESFFKRPVPADSLELKDGRWARELGEVTLGSKVAEAYGITIGDSITIERWVGGRDQGPMELKVCGTLQSTRSTWDRMLFTTVVTGQQALARSDLHDTSIWGPNVLSYFLVYLQPGGFDSLTALVNRRTVGQAVLVTHEKERLDNLTGTGKSLGLFVTVLILLLGGLSVTSMLITRFEAMALQLAVLRALGYRKRSIGQWLLWEGFLLGLAACLLGIVLDAMGFPLMRDLLGTALPPPEIVASSVMQSFPIWLTAIGATTASVFIPLYRVYHLDVHFSLRN